LDTGLKSQNKHNRNFYKTKQEKTLKKKEDPAGKRGRLPKIHIVKPSTFIQTCGIKTGRIIFSNIHFQLFMKEKLVPCIQ